MHCIEILAELESEQFVVRVGKYFDLSACGFCVCLGVFDRENSTMPFLMAVNRDIETFVADFNAARDVLEDGKRD